MLVLTLYQHKACINYKVYKLYQKKASLKLDGSIELASTKHPDYTKTISRSNLAEYNLDIIVYKIACGGNEYQNLQIINPVLIDKLGLYAQYNPEQAQDLEIAKECLKLYPNARHYATFDSGFHSQIDTPEQVLIPNWEDLQLGLKNYGVLGLTFAYLSSKLSDFSEKKIAKGRWVLVYLAEQQNVVCAVKNGKSLYCSGSGIHNELPSSEESGLFDHRLASRISDLTQLNILALANWEFKSCAEILNTQSAAAKLASEYLSSAIVNTITKAGNVLGGVDGIVFSGPMGQANPRLRQLICNRLSWLDVDLSNKANLENQCKLHKKSAKVQLFCKAAQPEQIMLQQLFERL